jgi:hypothetical protein
MDFTVYTLHLAKEFVYQAEKEIGKLILSSQDDETLRVFDSSCIREDEENGPRIERLSSYLVFEGARLDPPALTHASASAELPDGSTPIRYFTLPAGDYCFTQWRASDIENFEEGLEELLREAWWEGMNTEGPLYVRTLVEDGEVAIQGLRKRL